jgi:hypothetical protein
LCCSEEKDSSKRKLSAGIIFICNEKGWMMAKLVNGWEKSGTEDWVLF